MNDLLFCIFLYSPVALLLVIFAWWKKTLEPLRGALFILGLFMLDYKLLTLPSLLGWGFGEWNWVGKVCSIFFQVTIIYLFFRANVEQIGLKLFNPRRDLLLGFFVGLIPVGCNIIFSYFFATELQSTHVLETIFFQATMPGTQEELLYRGILFWLLASYLGNNGRILATVCLSILFINIHIFEIDKATQNIIWIGTLEQITFLIVATTALAYTRLKTSSIWPSILCHNIINTGSFLSALFLNG